MDVEDPREDQPLLGEPGRNKKESCRSFLGSTKFFLYCSHALSAWGDRMWQFAVGIFLAALSPDSLRLPAIFGFTSGGAVLLMGAFLGNWVDKYPRLRVAQTALIVQNVSIAVSAVTVCLALRFRAATETIWGGWLGTVCHVIIILFADIAQLGSIASTISVERDWIVVICDDKHDLTRTSAFMRRIDLTTNILAPVLTGQVMTFASMFVGAIFIAGWNLVSMVAEYYLLWKVYKMVPALAIKQRAEEENTDEEAEPPRSSGFCAQLFSTFLVLKRGWGTYMRQEIVLAGFGLAFLYMTVLGFDNITTGYAYQQGLSESLVSILMAVGALVGIFGTLLFPRFRKCIGLHRTGLFAYTFEILCLSMCVVSIWAPGSPWDPSFLTRGSRDTSTTTPPGVSLYNHNPVTILPSLNNQKLDTLDQSSYQFLNNNNTGMPSTPDTIYTTADVSFDDVTLTTSDIPGNSTAPRNMMSVILLMSGIVSARMGLWMADLTVTQLLLETPKETERGIVNGVQNSLNQSMDVLKFLLVILLPWQQTFGILILISFSFVCAGGVFYAIYSRKVRGHIMPFHKMFDDLAYVYTSAHYKACLHMTL